MERKTANCERCLHKPICEWCAENTKLFKFPKVGGTCDLMIDADLIEQQAAEINELQKSLNALGHANACLRGQIPEWIDVKDRLPDKGGNYLCRYGFQRDGCLGDYRTTGCLDYYAYDHRPHWQHESVGLFVTHWMPLPDPPEERKGGEG